MLLVRALHQDFSRAQVPPYSSWITPRVVLATSSDPLARMLRVVRVFSMVSKRRHNNDGVEELFRVRIPVTLCPDSHPRPQRLPAQRQCHSVAGDAIESAGEWLPVHER